MRRSEELKASPPMFDSPLLDRFTRVHPAVPVVMYLPVIGVLLALGIVASLNVAPGNSSWRRR